ncbi:MAG TPA: glycosyltransferase family 39 protein [Aggregatilineales bacterium]|nr:glycosyltransferase family 39 protein [Aggregatilineales bacterium]
MLVQHRLRNTALVLVVLVLIVIMMERVQQLSLSGREIHTDEIWSVWQLTGPQVDYTRDANWPPLYYMLLDGWWRFVGLHPVALRYLSVLFNLIGTACLYRAMRRLSDVSAARLGVLAFNAVALNVYLTAQVRSYALVVSLLPIAFWLALRYFDHPRLARGALLGVVMAAMFYTAYGSVGAFLMLGIYTLLVYRQAIWRWWLPGVVGGLLAVPAILHIGSLATGRLAPLSEVKLLPFGPAVVDLFTTDAGYSSVPWLILFAIATLMVVLYERPPRIRSLALLAWGLSVALIYVLNPLTGLFSAMYSWFIIPGLSLWIGQGLSYLPRLPKVAAALLLVGILFAPIPIRRIAAQGLPLGQSFEWLAANARWGDVIVIDPLWKDSFCNCIRAEMFEYLAGLYFPQGLQVVSAPEGYRRVWYLKWDGLQDKQFEARVRHGRVEGIFVGPPQALFRLYEAPPDSAGILFANGMRFHGIDLVDRTTNLLVRRSGDQFRIRLWWSVDHPVDLDYSVSLQVIADGRVAIQSDSAPQVITPEVPHETSRWQPGQYYIEEREVDVPRSMRDGTYPLYLVVYFWQNGARVSAPGVNSDNLLPIDKLYIKGF